MKKIVHALGATLSMVAASVALSVTPAQAGSGYSYFSFMGGTRVMSASNAVISDMTAASSIMGSVVPNSDSNQLAGVSVASSLVRTGAVNTSVAASKLDPNGVRVLGRAKTLGVSLLNGLIRADAVDTVNTVTGTKETGLTSSARTGFVGLKITNVNLPVTIPKNYTVHIPNLVQITLNGDIAATQDGVRISQGFGLRVRLLRTYGSLPLGATIILNPTSTAMSDEVPVGNPTLGGFAYGSSVKANVGGKLVEAGVGKTANVGTPPGGTNNEVRTNTTATVNVPGVITIGAVTSTTKGLSTAGFGEVTNTSEIAGLNVLGGLITADAIKVKAHSVRDADGFRPDESLTFVNLVIAGQAIPITVSPNTKIEIPGVATVIINERIRTANANRIRAVYVKLLEPNGGLETGSEIELGVAQTSIAL